MKTWCWCREVREGLWRRCSSTNHRSSYYFGMAKVLNDRFMGSIHAILDRFLAFPNCTYTPILVVGLDILLQVSCVVDNLSRDGGEIGLSKYAKLYRVTWNRKTSGRLSLWEQWRIRGVHDNFIRFPWSRSMLFSSTTGHCWKVCFLKNAFCGQMHQHISDRLLQKFDIIFGYTPED